MRTFMRERERLSLEGYDNSGCFWAGELGGRKPLLFFLVSLNIKSYACIAYSKMHYINNND